MSLVDQMNYQETSKGQKKLLDVAGAGLLPILPSSRASQRVIDLLLDIGTAHFFDLHTSSIQFGLQPFVGKGSPKRAKNRQQNSLANDSEDEHVTPTICCTLSAVLCFKKRVSVIRLS